MEEIIVKLVGLLDRIDTVPDMVKPFSKEAHETTWRRMVDIAGERGEVIKSDGYNLFTADMDKLTDNPTDGPMLYNCF